MQRFQLSLAIVCACAMLNVAIAQDPPKESVEIFTPPRMQIPDDDADSCQLPDPAELDEMGVNPEKEAVLLECSTDALPRDQCNLDELFAKNAEAKAETDRIKEEVEKVEVRDRKPYYYYQYRHACPNYDYYRWYSFVFWQGKRCWVLNPVRVNRCYRRTCRFRYFSDLWYHHYGRYNRCGPRYCKEYVWAVCLAQDGTCSIERIIMWKPCCCQCYSYYRDPRDAYIDSIRQTEAP